MVNTLSQVNNLSASNNRVVDVINFLAAHPTEAFTLSELAGHLSLSNGTAHRLLTSLTEARYLSRHSKHKTYSLGVALVAVGQAALEKHRGIDVTRREMARLAGELKGQLIATAIIDDELLFLAKEGMPESHDGLNRVGERCPFVPPLGLGHIAWGEREAVNSYLARAATMFDATMLDYLNTSLAAIRQRGYALSANGKALRALRQTAMLPVDYRRDEAYWSRLKQLIGQLSVAEIQLLDIADMGAEGISYISVPVFSPTGTVALEFSLSGIPIDMSIKEIEHYAERLCTSAAIVTSETHGRPPVGAAPF